MSKVGRNDPCPCESGKKYKRCCGGPTAHEDEIVRKVVAVNEQIQHQSARLAEQDPVILGLERPAETRSQAVFVVAEKMPAAGFYRGAVPARWLQRHGVRAEVLDADTTRSLSPTPAAWHFHPISLYQQLLFEHMCRRRWPCFIGLDDNPWEEVPQFRNMLTGLNPAHRILMPAFEKMICACEGVIATTEPIAEAARRFNANVVIVPNALPPLGELPAPRVHADDPETLRLGWAGAAAHDSDLDLLTAPLRRLCRAYPRVHIVFFGRVPDRLASHSQVEAAPWVPMSRYYTRLADLVLDVFMAPLLGHSFNDARSNLKALDAGALGIPFVGSNVGPYKRTVQHGVTGLLVENTEDAWYEALRTLIEEPALRRELGENGRRWVAESGTIETTGPLWAKALGVGGL